MHASDYHMRPAVSAQRQRDRHGIVDMVGAGVHFRAIARCRRAGSRLRRLISAIAVIVVFLEVLGSGSGALSRRSHMRICNAALTPSPDWAPA